jgi:uncharacterized protein
LTPVEWSKTKFDAGKDATGATGGRCPICGKPRVQNYRPFCSRRCADIDLGRWLNGIYVVPGCADSDEDGEAMSSSGQPNI